MDTCYAEAGSTADAERSLQCESTQLNSASSLEILHRNSTASEASRKRREYFLWGRVENICVELLIPSEVLNRIPALHRESSPQHHQESLIEGCIFSIVIPAISIALSKHNPFQCVPVAH